MRRHAVSWLRRLVAGLSPRRPGFAPGSVHVGILVDKLALRQVLLRVLRFSPANIIPPLPHIHLSPPHEVFDSSDQVAHYHHLGPKLGASSLTRHFGWKQNKKNRDSPYSYNLGDEQIGPLVAAVLRRDLAPSTWWSSTSWGMARSTTILNSQFMIGASEPYRRTILGDESWESCWISIYQPFEALLIKTQFLPKRTLFDSTKTQFIKVV
jgi:hypothetical protein